MFPDLGMQVTVYLAHNNMANHNDFGKEAEFRAAKFLEKKNYEILKRNWRFLKAEIDIIAKDLTSNQIVIVEVKARKANPLVEPELAVTKTKRKLLVQAADHFIVSNEITLETRFDIITVSKSGTEWKINHIENAFLSFE